MAINIGPTPPTTATPIDVDTQNSPDNSQIQTAPAPDQPQVRSVPVPFVPPHVGRLAQLGHAASQLLGQSYDYRVNPQTGQTEQIPIKQKPGDLFRHMVAGALLGGASAEGGHSVMEGIAKGGTASIQQQQQQDLLRRSQAEGQFKNQLAASEEQRRQAEFQTQQRLGEAQIAHMNAATAHENTLTQGETFKQHEDMANFGKAQMQPFLDAGLKPVYRDKPESEMQDLIKNNPSAANLLWEPTGMKHGVDAKGNPTYEATYTAVNPTGKVKLTPQTISAWKDAGMDKYDPGMFDVAKPGYEMDARDYMTVNNRAQVLYNNKLQNEKTQAETSEYKARAGQANAAAAREMAAAAKDKLDIKQSGLLNKAIEALNDPDVKGDFDKLRAKNPGAALVIGESTKSILQDLNATYRAQLQAQAPEASETLKQIEQYSKLAADSLSLNKPAPAGPTGTESTPKPGTPEAEVGKTVQAVKEASQKQDDEEAVRTFMQGNFSLAPEMHGPLANAARATLKANPKWSTQEKAQYVRKILGSAATPPGQVSVQIPGKDPGFIPRENLEKFKKANPNAIVNE